MIENVIIWIAFALPRRLAYWAAIRVMAHAARANPNRTIGTLTPADCLEAWSIDK